MNKREFLKISGLGTAGLALLPTFSWGREKYIEKLRTAHIGVGNMGFEDLKAISSHKKVEVAALCDVDSIYLEKAHKLYPNAKVYRDYRLMLKEMKDQIDAVIVSTPDHTHAPASLMAMEMNKAVYCQKPLTHHVSEARAMKKLASDKNLVTQMGIQVHSFYDYKLATLLIQSGIIGKVHRVHAWSPKNWGYDGNPPEGSDSIPENLDWNLWLGTAKKRLYKEGYYHPMNWRKLLDYGCGTLGDMGVHIFDTPYNALQLDVPFTVKTECRTPNNYGFPENNTVTYEFPGTKFTGKTLTWIWYDGKGAPNEHKDLILPDSKVKSTDNKTTEQSIEEKVSLETQAAAEGQLPDQGAMFVGDKGRLLLPHFMQLPKKIVSNKYVDISKEIQHLSKKHSLGEPIRNYESEGPKHYHQFVDACLGKDECSAPFSYAARLTETILLGVIAGRFPNKTLHWNNKTAKFSEEEANQFLDSTYRNF
ncbi:Gfo/Idh/MocA family protein [Aegicerativicinus sediminis]|uniref:Gfo/Idh/MocA family protein n=1 Tax=Aegicerativicinus sediminis TaxID=2893202 RepID=UPI001E409519|nr:Gfo/Idh/MocA family oxidoreductase [Aegicerativicinus sediminis]